eukprot:g1877.t1
MAFRRDTDGTPASPWHDIPHQVPGNNGLLHFVCEIPRYEKAKMEVATTEAHNAIAQDVKKGALRYYHGPIYWNYGCVPQTWEDPRVAGSAEVHGAFGDNDPLDVVEVGTSTLPFAAIVPVKPLGALAMLDDGELDWKLIAIRADDPLAEHLHDVHDIEAHLPGTVSGIREWFRWYKTPDGKPTARFGFDGEPLDAAGALGVVSETHEHYCALLAEAAAEAAEQEQDEVVRKLWLPNAA